MTKAELIDIVAEEIDGVSKTQIGQIYDSIFETIAKAVKEDDKQRYIVKDFGTFELKKRKERTGVNPATREPMKIPAKTTVSFRPSKALEDKVS